MKSIFFIKLGLIFTAITILFSCSSDEEISQNEEFLNQLKLVQTINNGVHDVDIYTTNGVLLTGYNQVYLQIKNGDGTYVDNASITWQPMMHMMSHSHSTPASKITKKPDSDTFYTGHLVFQMATNTSEYWDLEINYTINEVNYQAKSDLVVNQASNRNLQTFTGTDNIKYVMALVAPTEPKVAINTMSAVLYKMQSMTNFEMATNYTIKIDPRMPSMGNHTSPNNTSLTQATDLFYYGNLSLTMTGYWQINLQVLNENNQIIKGDLVTDDTPASSIYFDIEF